MNIKQSKNRNTMKKIILFVIIFVFVLLVVFTQFYANLWCLVTYNSYFIPNESNIFIFEATKISDGSGEAWLYGEDNTYYYGLNVEQDNLPEYFKLKKGYEPKNFDKFDYHTWQIQK